MHPALEFPPLEINGRVRKGLKVAHVVPMSVGEQYHVDVRGIKPDRGQEHLGPLRVHDSIAGRLGQPRLICLEAGVDDGEVTFALYDDESERCGKHPSVVLAVEDGAARELRHLAGL